MNARKTNTIRKSVENLEARDVPAQLATIQSISFGDGSSQRSMVREMTVNFTDRVELTESLVNAISVQRTNYSNETGPIGDVGIRMELSDDATSLVLSFTAGELTQAGGSVVDGFYDLTVDASQIDVNGDISGVTKNDDYAFTIHGNLKNKMFRLAGDVTGDGRVNRYDANVFSTAYLGKSDAFDFDGDGIVSQCDFEQLDANFGVKL